MSRPRRAGALRPDLGAPATDAGSRIRTPRLLLRPLRMSDVDALHRLHSDPRVVRYLTIDVETRGQTRRYLRAAEREEQRRPLRCLERAIDTHAGEFVGRCGVRVERTEHAEGQLWYVLDPAFQGRGLAREAVRALLTEAFEQLGLHRIFADCDPRNAASLRLCEALSMRREAHLRENWHLKGEWCDSIVFGLLASEWKASEHRTRDWSGGSAEH